MQPSSIFSFESVRGLRLRFDPVLALVLLLLAGVETGLRWAAGSAGEQSLLHRVRAAEKDGYYPSPHVNDPVRGYRYRPNYRGRLIRTDFDNEVITNNYGFRGLDFSKEKAPSTYRLALLGDSVLAANQVPIQSTWAHLLEGRLAPVNGKRVEVLNFAVDGYATWNQRQLLEKEVLQFEPDAVILYADYRWMKYPWELHRVVTNRDRVLISSDRELLFRTLEEENRMALSLRHFMLRTSYTARLLSLLGGKKPVEESTMRFVRAELSNPYSIPALLGEMRDLSYESGARFGVLYRGAPPDPKQNPSRLAGIPFVSDVSVLSSYEGMTWPNDEHFTLEGNVSYAEVVTPLFDAMLRVFVREETVLAASTMSAPPDPNETTRYLFYLHGAIVEGRGSGVQHPRFGAYEYDEVADRFAASGWAVISEVRPSGIQVETYAKKVARQVEALLAKSVPAANIVIMGHSKGGSIALEVASQLQRDDLRFVILAGCFSGTSWQKLNPKGRFLSIYDASDEIAGSCLERGAEAGRLEEIRLEVGEGHGLFFRPRDSWVERALDWLG